MFSEREISLRGTLALCDIYKLINNNFCNFFDRVVLIILTYRMEIDDDFDIVITFLQKNEEFFLVYK